MQKEIEINITYTYIIAEQHEHLGSFGIINMNGRIFDPNTASFFSPDPFVQAPYNSQNFNRYSYCLNNPLMYTDPSGEIIHWIIGGLSGAYSGWQIGKSMGAKGWGMFGYIMGGAAIGTASAGLGSFVSTSIGSSTAFTSALGVAAGGATSGIISGAGFTALAGGDGNQIFKAGLFGGISGGFGSIVGTQIGGGWGALIGGAVSSGTNAALNGGNGHEILRAALYGGATSWAAYQGSSYYYYKKSGSDLTFSQFKTMNIAAQKSFMKEIEYGGWITTDNKIDMGPPGTATSVTLPNRDIASILSEFHTHWEGPEGFSLNPDILNINKYFGNRNDYNPIVIARQGVYSYSTLTGGTTFLYPSYYHNPYFTSSYFYFTRDFFNRLRK